MATTLVRNSRLRFGIFAAVDGVEFFDVLDLPAIPPQSDDLVHVVRDDERIDLLAYRYYKDPVLWWVIAIANDIELVPFGLSPGDRLRIPSPAFVTQQLMRGALR